MQNIVQDSLGSRRFPTLLLSAFALLALVLAAVGIVGVVSYSVAQRTHEVGIRMALGARAADVLKLMVSGTMTWVAVGIRCRHRRIPRPYPLARDLALTT